LILLDLMMPRMDGREFLRRQSADPSIAGIPTIVSSGSKLPVGAKHQLAKPVDVKRLRALVDHYCWAGLRPEVLEICPKIPRCSGLPSFCGRLMAVVAEQAIEWINGSFPGIIYYS
jgi:hypothetical protein